MDWEAVGRRVRLLRGPETQVSFAKIMRCSTSMISDIENAKVKPSAEFIFRLTEWSGRSYSWILTGREEGVPEVSRWRAAEEKDPPHVISMKKDTELYNLVRELGGLPSKEKSLFYGIVFAVLGALKKR